MNWKKEGKVEVILQMAEIETTRFVVMDSESQPQSFSLKELSRTLSERALVKLKEDFPIKGKVVSVKPNVIRLNIGKQVGVKEKDRFEILETAGKVVLETFSVNEDFSLAKKIQGENSLKELFSILIFKKK